MTVVADVTHTSYVEAAVDDDEEVGSKAEEHPYSCEVAYDANKPRVEDTAEGTVVCHTEDVGGLVTHSTTLVANHPSSILSEAVAAPRQRHACFRLEAFLALTQAWGSTAVRHRQDKSDSE